MPNHNRSRALTNQPATIDGQTAERIRPDPLPLPLPDDEPFEPIEAPALSESDPTELEADSDDEIDNVLLFRRKQPKRGRKKSEATTFRVDYVKASRNTFAFRIRWKEPDGTEPAAYVSRVNDKLFTSITKGKIRYAAFKKQLIASYLSRTIRQGNGIDASANRAV